MEKPELPPLPKPTTGYYYAPEKGRNDYTAYTADQMREYGAECAKVVREYLARQVGYYRDAGTDLSLSDVEDLIQRGKGAI